MVVKDSVAYPYTCIDIILIVVIDLLPYISYVFGTPYLLTILVLTFGIVHSTICGCVYNIAVYIANSIDLIRCCILQHLIWIFTVLKGLSVPILNAITVY